MVDSVANLKKPSNEKAKICLCLVTLSEFNNNDTFFFADLGGRKSVYQRGL